MFSPLSNRFGIPGVISVIALVFAMFGGAYAATNNSKGKATASAKAKKGPRGPKGATGPAGAAGPAGPAGPVGAKGDTGPKGDKGDTGPQGKEGSQGKEGKQGKEGSPWTAGGTLPPGKTETGTWTAGNGPEKTNQRVPLSFAIPLAESLSGEGCESNPPAATCHVHYINEAGMEVPSEGQELASASCHGKAAKPSADPGHLCIYLGIATPGLGASNERILNAEGTGLGASTAGAILRFSIEGETTFGDGSWAVTAEE